MRNLTIDEFLKKRSEDKLNKLSEHQEHELTEYIAILLKEMFQEFTHSKKFSKYYVPL